MGEGRIEDQQHFPFFLSDELQQDPELSSALA